MVKSDPKASEPRFALNVTEPMTWKFAVSVIGPFIVIVEELEVPE